MKIGILSDTHDKLPGIELAIAIFQDHQVDVIIHAGDWVKPDALKALRKLVPEHTKLYGVYGNNDDRSDLDSANQSLDYPMELAESLIIPVESLKIGVAHGDRPQLLVNVSSSCDVIIRGHSHRASVESRDGKLYVNPGSTSHTVPKSLEDRRTVAILNIAGDTSSAEILPLVP